jgi:hypothetical protein
MKNFYFLLLLFVPFLAYSKTIVVSPTGNDENFGSLNSPVYTLNAAWSKVDGPGDIIYMRGGTYYYGKQVLSGKNGVAGNMIKIWAYPGEKPVIRKQGAYAGTAWPRAIIRVSANYIHMKGLEICYNTQEDGEIYMGLINLNGSYNIYEQLDLHHNSLGMTVEYNSTGNLILNCDAHHNSDPLTAGSPYGNADGFGFPWIPPGSVNTIRGCRAWWNTDDGYDIYRSDHTFIVDSCWAWNNGYLPDTHERAGDGNGFKLGITLTEFGDSLLIHVTRSLAYRNRQTGFHQNGALAAIKLYNNTAYMNGNQGFWFGSYSKKHVLKNNIAYANGSYCVLTSQSIVENNNFLINNTANPAFNVTDADFMKLTDYLLTSPRKPDGSLPDISFLYLANGSDLIDAGVNVGLPYIGDAPDLGAFEKVPGFTSVKPGIGAENIKIYPVPARDYISIEGLQAYKGEAHIRFYDITGALRSETMINAASQSNIPLNLAPGIYILRIDSGSELVTIQKILILK